MGFKFERLEIWQMALDYTDRIYRLSAQLPRDEEYNLKSQIRRAATSIALNIAEGSTSQSDAEQRRFVGIAIRSLVETVACLHLINRHARPTDIQLLRETYRDGEKLFAKLQAFQRALSTTQLREDTPVYDTDGSLRFWLTRVAPSARRSAVSGRHQL